MMKYMVLFIFYLFCCQTSLNNSDKCIECLFNKNEDLVVQLRAFEAGLKENGMIKQNEDYFLLPDKLVDKIINQSYLLYNPSNLAHFIDCIDENMHNDDFVSELNDIILAPSQYLVYIKKHTKSSLNYKEYLSGVLNKTTQEYLEYEVFRFSILFACLPILEGI